MTKEEATKILNIYGEAWMKKDPDLIVSIFTDDAVYNDPHEPENVGREAIRSYWVSKVVNGQSDITFDLKNVWVNGDTVIAEWHANFIDTIRNVRIKMREVGIFKVKAGMFASLREYYTAEKAPL
jgi:uncharacterized protein (TIGR02246 family)